MGLRESDYYGKLMNSPSGDASMEEMPEQSSPSHHSPVGVEKTSYWDFTEVKLLFFPCKNETTQQSIMNQIAVLSDAMKTNSGYLAVIQGNEEIDNDTLTNHQKHMIHRNAKSCVLH